MQKILNKILAYTREHKIHNFELEYFSFHRFRYGYLLNALDRHPRGMKLLDIGAGYLHFLMGARELGFTSLYAVDIPAASPLLSARSKEYGIALRLNCDLKSGRLPYENDYFDLVFISETLEHFDFHPLPVFEEIFRILKPGGALLITTPNLTRLNNRIKMLIGRSINYDIKADYRYGAHFREYNHTEVRFLLGDCGFNEIELHYVDFSYPNQKYHVRLLNLLFGLIFPSLRGNLAIAARKPVFT